MSPAGLTLWSMLVICSSSVLIQMFLPIITWSLFFRLVTLLILQHGGIRLFLSRAKALSELCWNHTSKQTATCRRCITTLRFVFQYKWWCESKNSLQLERNHRKGDVRLQLFLCLKVLSYSHHWNDGKWNIFLNLMNYVKRENCPYLI